MPKDEKQAAGENAVKMPAADAQQRMIEWAESVLNNFTPQDAMTYDEFANLPQVQPYISKQCTVTERHEYVDVTEEVKKTAKIGDEAKILMDLVTNNGVFGEFAEGGEGYVNTAPRGMPATNVYTAIGFDKLADSIQRKLTAFDECVFEYTASIILANLSAAGTLPEISVNQICLAMTNGKTSGGRLYQQVQASLQKMRFTSITIKNTDEVDEGADYQQIIAIDHQLLPINFAEKYYKGRIEVVMQFMEMPVLLLFAKGRNQIASISTELALCPTKKTPVLLAVYRYLLWLILLNNGPKAIKFDTICEHCKITDEKEKYRMQMKDGYLEKFFKHFKQCNAIESYHFQRENLQLKKISFTRVNKGAKRLEKKH